jgi:AcrR family transcriptional regulator
MAGKAKKTQRLSPHDWVVEALETLRRESIVGVSVENIARSMGVTKGSFYYHFKDKEELVDWLLEYWETELTDKVNTHVSHLHGTPAEQLLALLEFTPSTRPTGTMRRCVPGRCTTNGSQGS